MVEIIKKYEFIPFDANKNPPADSCIYPLTLEDSIQLVYARGDENSEKIRLRQEEIIINNLKNNLNYYTPPANSGVESLVRLTPFHLQKNRRYLEKKHAINMAFRNQNNVLREIHYQELAYYRKNPDEMTPLMRYMKPKGLLSLIEDPTGTMQTVDYFPIFNHFSTSFIASPFLPEHKDMANLREILQPHSNQRIRYLLKDNPKNLDYYVRLPVRVNTGGLKRYPRWNITREQFENKIAEYIVYYFNRFNITSVDFPTLPVLLYEDYFIIWEKDPENPPKSEIDLDNYYSYTIFQQEHYRLGLLKQDLAYIFLKIKCLNYRPYASCDTMVDLNGMCATVVAKLLGERDVIENSMWAIDDQEIFNLRGSNNIDFSNVGNFIINFGVRDKNFINQTKHFDMQKFLIEKRVKIFDHIGFEIINKYFASTNSEVKIVLDQIVNQIVNVNSPKKESKCFVYEDGKNIVEKVLKKKQEPFYIKILDPFINYLPIISPIFASLMGITLGPIILDSINNFININLPFFSQGPLQEAVTSSLELTDQYNNINNNNIVLESIKKENSSSTNPSFLPVIIISITCALISAYFCC